MGTYAQNLIYSKVLSAKSRTCHPASRPTQSGRALEFGFERIMSDVCSGQSMEVQGMFPSKFKVYAQNPSKKMFDTMTVQGVCHEFISISMGEHITPILIELHWLPFEFRIQYKLVILAFRYFEGTLPPYLSYVLHTYQPPCVLQSSSEKLLKIIRVNLKSAGERFI